MHNEPTTGATAHAGSRTGLLAVFGSTLFQLSGVFMLSPLMLVLLTEREVSTTIAGLFAATTWLGIFIVTPFASALTRRWGRRRAMWFASGVPLAAAVGFLSTDSIAVWFVLELLAGIAGGMRWVLAEALIAEFSPPERLGRTMGMYATMVGATFIIGPSLLAWAGSTGHVALGLVIALLTLGLVWTMFIPPIPTPAEAGNTSVGPRGLWQAVQQHPILMLAGFIGGFFELGLASILPLYGLSMGLGASAAALLISVSGLGSTLAAIPVGMAADRFADPVRGRRSLMVAVAAVALVCAAALPLVEHAIWVAWPVVFLLGAAGSSLYTLCMTDIGAREKGIALVNCTAVLVLNYTLGGLVASGISGALIDWSATVAFPAVLILVAAVGLAALLRTGRKAA
ncbi:MAG: MFS transporter [Acidovorax sp.]|uniref:MFS transporter n=1 Tax=Acidovorax sp. TaxID=1872122 RepID=UPI00262EC17A|nr:MFS transporter [Acidovorax sp.]MDH4425330.1 MFS transporter [Acidovorax sp.]